MRAGLPLAVAALLAVAAGAADAAGAGGAAAGASGAPVAATAPATPSVQNAAAAVVSPCTGAPPLPDTYITQLCSYFTASSNIRKLGAAVELNTPDTGTPSPIYVDDMDDSMVDPGDPDHGDGSGTIADFQLMHPIKSRGKFLIFGFMPATATIELDQQGMTRIHAYEAPSGDHQLVDDSANPMKVVIRITDVTVNGAPLDVGADCRTRTAATIPLGADPDRPFTLLTSGNMHAMQGVYTIPAFTGCGAHEDLSNLLTANVSGPGNFLEVTLGSVVNIANTRIIPSIPTPYR